MRSLALVSVLLAMLLPAPRASQAFQAVWSLAEFQPNIPQGGRANAIAVRPGNSNIMLVASETGGLFETRDRGATWKHVDAFLPYAPFSVAYVPADPNIVIATAADNFGDGGGIWRSVDAGRSWTHVPRPATANAFYAAFDISIAPDTGRIAVATWGGVAISDDRGATWTTPRYPGSAVSVLALAGNVLLAGDEGPLQRSVDDGQTWTTVATTSAGLNHVHAFARSPVDPAQAYMVDRATQLFVTEDRGLTWTRIASAPAGSSYCGGIPFIKATRTRRGGLALYFGNRCQLWRLFPPRIAGTTRFDYSGPWSASSIDHVDTRDLAFATSRFLPPEPVLLATDGGVHRTSDGGSSWQLTGGGVNGYNALQITEVKGQWIDDIGRYDLYFGTQDNNVLASTDGGTTWPNAVCCEGFHFDMQKHVGTAADSQITVVTCGPCSASRSGAGFSNGVNWDNAPGASSVSVAMVARSFHTQPSSAGYAVTRDLGASWSEYATFEENVIGQAKLTRDPWQGLPVQYQVIRTGFDSASGFPIHHLARISKNAGSDTASVTYPAMNNLRSIAINPTMFAWYPVFAVDPADSRFMIAADYMNGKMMETSDGGENWTEMPQLTGLVTDSGRTRFTFGIYSQPSAIGYSADDPNVVAVATRQNGIMVSTDHGFTWTAVLRSIQATYATSVEWRTSTDAIVSTYGRGLFRMQASPWIKKLDPLCVVANCLLKWIDRGDPVPGHIERGIVVLGGRMLGARVVRGHVVEVFVSPGSSVGFTESPESAPRVKVTETRHAVGLRGSVRGLKAWPRDGQDVVALALDASGGLRGFALARTTLSIRDPDSPSPVAATGEPPKTRALSPTRDKPYVRLDSPNGDVERLVAGERLRLTGRRFAPGETLELRIDGQVVEKLVVGKDGTFSATVVPPPELGVHTLTVQDAASGRVIDGAQFAINRGRPRGELQERGVEHDEDERAGEPIRITPPARRR